MTTQQRIRLTKLADFLEHKVKPDSFGLTTWVPQPSAYVLWPTAIVLSGLFAWFDFVAFLREKESIQRFVRLGRKFKALTDIRHRF